MEFQTDKDKLTASRLMGFGNDAEDFTLADGDILVRLERFAFTANNVTYGAIGKQIGYWQFFEPYLNPGDTDTAWGIIPVWGFGVVEESQNPDIEAGERLYGYFPMAHYLQIAPTRISAERLVDGAPHRAELPAVYNNYARLGKAAGDATADSLRALLNPLYGTSFCLCDALQEEDWHGGEQVVILSASSKTAIGLAYGLSKIEGARPKIVGLTSSSNADFVKKTGVYDSVISYDALDALPNKPSVLVDMSGNRAVIGAVHARLGDNMRWCHNVGLTHWDDSETKDDPNATKIIRDRSAMFFAPGHIAQRSKEWGADAFNEKVTEFLAGGMAHARDWMEIKEVAGLENFKATYEAVLAGDIQPHEGIIVVL